jgi:hypothetical protein
MGSAFLCCFADQNASQSNADEHCFGLRFDAQPAK